MRINRGLLGWGGFLVLVGAVPLAVRAGYLTDDQVGSLDSLWPLILIGVGIGILLARTRLAFLGGLLIAPTLGLIVGGVLSGEIEGFGACGPGRDTTAFEPREGAFGAGPGSIDIHLNCGDLDISTVAGSNWRIEGDDRDGTGPDVQSENGSLSVRSRDRAGGPFGLGDRETWRITLPVDVRFDLNLELNAGTSIVSLGGASVDALELQLNAGSATVDLGLVERIGEMRMNLNARIARFDPAQSVGQRLDRGQRGQRQPVRSTWGGAEAHHQRKLRRRL